MVMMPGKPTNKTYSINSVGTPRIFTPVTTDFNSYEIQSKIKYRLQQSMMERQAKEESQKEVISLGDVFLNKAARAKAAREYGFENAGPILKTLSATVRLGERLFNPDSPADFLMNWLRTFADTMDTLSLLIKAPIIAQQEHVSVKDMYVRAYGLGDEGREYMDFERIAKNSDWIPDNFFVYMIGEVITDPLALTVLGSAAKAAAKGTTIGVMRLASATDNAFYRWLTKIPDDVLKYADDVLGVSNRALKGAPGDLYKEQLRKYAERLHKYVKRGNKQEFIDTVMKDGAKSGYLKAGKYSDDVGIKFEQLYIQHKGNLAYRALWKMDEIENNFMKLFGKYNPITGPIYWAVRGVYNFRTIKSIDVLSASQKFTNKYAEVLPEDLAKVTLEEVDAQIDAVEKNIISLYKRKGFGADTGEYDEWMEQLQELRSLRSRKEYFNVRTSAEATIVELITKRDLLQKEYDDMLADPKYATANKTIDYADRIQSIEDSIDDLKKAQNDALIELGDSFKENGKTIRLRMSESHAELDRLKDELVKAHEEQALYETKYTLHKGPIVRLTDNERRRIGRRAAEEIEQSRTRIAKYTKYVEYAKEQIAEYKDIPELSEFWSRRRRFFEGVVKQEEAAQKTIHKQLGYNLRMRKDTSFITSERIPVEQIKYRSTLDMLSNQEQALVRNTDAAAQYKELAAIYEKQRATIRNNYLTKISTAREELERLVKEQYTLEETLTPEQAALIAKKAELNKIGHSITATQEAISGGKEIPVLMKRLEGVAAEMSDADVLKGIETDSWVRLTNPDDARKAVDDMAKLENEIAELDAELKLFKGTKAQFDTKQLTLNEKITKQKILKLEIELYETFSLVFDQIYGNEKYGAYILNVLYKKENNKLLQLFRKLVEEHKMLYAAQMKEKSAQIDDLIKNLERMADPTDLSEIPAVRKLITEYKDLINNYVHKEEVLYKGTTDAKNIKYLEAQQTIIEEYVDRYNTLLNLISDKATANEDPIANLVATFLREIDELVKADGTTPTIKALKEQVNTLSATIDVTDPEDEVYKGLQAQLKKAEENFRKAKEELYEDFNIFFKVMQDAIVESPASAKSYKSIKNTIRRVQQFKNIDIATRTSEVAELRYNAATLPSKRTLQKLFRLYEEGASAGKAGTASTEAVEVYNKMQGAFKLIDEVDAQKMSGGTTQGFRHGAVKGDIELDHQVKILGVYAPLARVIPRGMRNNLDWAKFSKYLGHIEDQKMVPELVYELERIMDALVDYGPFKKAFGQTEPYAPLVTNSNVTIYEGVGLMEKVYRNVQKIYHQVKNITNEQQLLDAQDFLRTNINARLSREFNNIINLEEFQMAYAIKTLKRQTQAKGKAIRESKNTTELVQNVLNEISKNDKFYIRDMDVFKNMDDQTLIRIAEEANHRVGNILTRIVYDFDNYEEKYATLLYKVMDGELDASSELLSSVRKTLQDWDIEKATKQDRLDVLRKKLRAARKTKNEEQIRVLSREVNILEEEFNIRQTIESEYKRLMMRHRRLLDADTYTIDELLDISPKEFADALAEDGVPLIKNLYYSFEYDPFFKLIRNMETYRLLSIDQVNLAIDDIESVLIDLFKRDPDIVQIYNSLPEQTKVLLRDEWQRYKKVTDNQVIRAMFEKKILKEYVKPKLQSARMHLINHYRSLWGERLLSNAPVDGVDFSRLEDVIPFGRLINEYGPEGLSMERSGQLIDGVYNKTFFDQYKTNRETIGMFSRLDGKQVVLDKDYRQYNYMLADTETNEFEEVYQINIIEMQYDAVKGWTRQSHTHYVKTEHGVGPKSFKFTGIDSKLYDDKAESIEAVKSYISDIFERNDIFVAQNVSFDATSIAKLTDRQDIVLMDTLPYFRATLRDVGLENTKLETVARGVLGDDYVDKLILEYIDELQTSVQFHNAIIDNRMVAELMFNDNSVTSLGKQRYALNAASLSDYDDFIKQAGLYAQWKEITSELNTLDYTDADSAIAKLDVAFKKLDFDPHPSVRMFHNTVQEAHAYLKELDALMREGDNTVGAKEFKRRVAKILVLREYLDKNYETFTKTQRGLYSFNDSEVTQSMLDYYNIYRDYTDKLERMVQAYQAKSEALLNALYGDKTVTRTVPELTRKIALGHAYFSNDNLHTLMRILKGQTTGDMINDTLASGFSRFMLKKIWPEYAAEGGVLIHPVTGAKLSAETVYAEYMARTGRGAPLRDLFELYEELEERMLLERDIIDMTGKHFQKTGDNMPLHTAPELQRFFERAYYNYIQFTDEAKRSAQGLKSALMKELQGQGLNKKLYELTGLPNAAQVFSEDNNIVVRLMRYFEDHYIKQEAKGFPHIDIFANADTTTTNAMHDKFNDYLVYALYNLDVSTAGTNVYDTFGKTIGLEEYLQAGPLYNKFLMMSRNAVDDMRKPLRAIKEQNRVYATEIEHIGEMNRYIQHWAEDGDSLALNLKDASFISGLRSEIAYRMTKRSRAHQRQRHYMYQLIEGISKGFNETERLPVANLDPSKSPLYKLLSGYGIAPETLFRYVDRNVQKTIVRDMKVEKLDNLMRANHPYFFRIKRFVNEMEVWADDGYRTYLKVDEPTMTTDPFAKAEFMERLKASLFDHLENTKSVDYAQAKGDLYEAGWHKLDFERTTAQAVRAVGLKMGDSYSVLREAFRDPEELLGFVKRTKKHFTVYVPDEAAPYGFRIDKMRVNNVEDITQIDALMRTGQANAVGILDDHEIQVIQRMLKQKAIWDENKSWEQLASKIHKYFVQPVKVISLATVNFITNNMVDINFKNAVAARGGLINPFSVYQSTVKAAKWYDTYNKVYYKAMEVLDWSKYGKLSVANWVDDYAAYLKGMGELGEEIEMNLHIVRFVDEFLQTPAAASEMVEMAKSIQKGFIGQGKHSGTVERWMDKILYGKWGSGKNLNPFSYNLQLNSMAESVGRLGLYIDELANGYTKNDALLKILKTHFNYSNKSKGELWAELVIPFVSYPLYSLGFWSEAFFKDYTTTKILVEFMEQIWGHETLEENDYARYQASRGNIPLGNYAFQSGLTYMDAMSMFQRKEGTVVPEQFVRKINPVIKQTLNLQNLDTKERIGRLPGISQLRQLGRVGTGQANDLGDLFPSVLSPWYGNAKRFNYTRRGNFARNAQFSKAYSYQGNQLYFYGGVRPDAIGQLRYRWTDIQRYYRT